MGLFWFLLDLSIVNTHILFLKRHAAFTTGIDCGDIQPNSVGAYELGCDYPAMKFRLEVAKHLLPTGAAKGPKIQSRSDYKRKISRIYFTRHRCGHVTAVASIVGVRDSEGTQSHYLTKITKRHECIVCRLDF